MTPTARRDLLNRILVCVCLALLAFLCLYKYLYDFTTALTVSADVCLFALAGARFIPVWTRAWSTRPQKERAKRACPARCCAAAFLCVLAFHACLCAANYIYQLNINGFDGTFLESLCKLADASDSKHYLDIAENFYVNEGSTDRIVRLVFLPFYPLLIKCVSYITRDYTLAAVVVSVLCSCTAGTCVFRLAAREYGQKAGFRALRYFCLLPGAFFYFTALTESVFVLESLLLACFLQDRKYLPACVCGCLAAFTRTVGIILIVPVMFQMISDIINSDRKARRALVCACELLVIPLGFFAYLCVNKYVSGSWFKFLEYESEHWHQHVGWFFDTVRYQTQYAASYLQSGSVHEAFGLWIANIAAQLGALAVMAAGIKRVRPAFGAYFIAYFAVAMGVSWLLSAPRYLLTCFPVLLALTRMTRRKSVDVSLSLLLAAASCAYFYAYLNGWMVY
ncbi:MAG: hypothetical protein IKR85_09625 [Clostridia bacterium]|nr:hypothetical protein [Clostridia bacterium]